MHVPFSPDRRIRIGLFSGLGALIILAFGLGAIGHQNVAGVTAAWWHKQFGPPPPPSPPPVFEPTFQNVAYGPAPSQQLDFWQARSERPTPVVVFFHGGGFVGGDKTFLWPQGDVMGICRNAGVSVVSVNYRFCNSAPLSEILHDATRAIQFLRSQAGEWNLDKARIAVYGESAGAGMALYTAAHDDVAVPDSPDPVLRESSRVCAVGVLDGQFSYNFPLWESVIGPYPDQNNKPKWEFYYWQIPGVDPATPRLRALLDDGDLRAQLSAGDPPIFLYASQKFGPATSHDHYLHHPQHAVALQEKCEQVGIESELVLEDSPTPPVLPRNELVLGFLLNNLGVY